MSKTSFSRGWVDTILVEFESVLKADPKGIDPADDTSAEVAYLCLAAKTAGSRFRFISLGAAPGEWAYRAERIYRHSTPNGDYLSLNLEGDLDHVKMTESFWSEHGADLKRNILRYGVVSAKDGWAYFPVINPELDWGAGMAAWSEQKEDLGDNITMTEQAISDRIGANNGKPLEFRTVQAFSLASLIDEIEAPVDFIHCDIQGHESEVFQGNMETITAGARRACVATHSSEIEGELTEAFATHGWELEASWRQIPGRDGTFIWFNPRL